MMVLGNDVFCICFEGTVHKLVIIRVCCNQTEMVVNLNHFGVGQVKQGLDNIGSNLRTNLLSKYLFVLSQNLICDAKSIFPVDEISPNGIITTATRKRHQQAVGVENDIHYCLYGVRMCSFFQSSITLSLSTPSSHSWSMASSARLAKYWPSKRRISVISRSEFTFATSSSISIWNGVKGVDCKVEDSILFLLFCFVSAANLRIKSEKTSKTKKKQE